MDGLRYYEGRLSDQQTALLQYQRENLHFLSEEVSNIHPLIEWNRYKMLSPIFHLTFLDISVPFPKILSLQEKLSKYEQSDDGRTPQVKIFSGKLSFPLPIAHSFLIFLNVKCLVGWSGTSFSFSRSGVEDPFSWGNTYLFQKLHLYTNVNLMFSLADESTSVWATACSFFDSRERCRGAACQQYQQSGICRKI